MDASGPGPGPEEQKVRLQSGDLSGGAQMAASNPKAAYNNNHQSSLGYSDLEVAEPPFVAGLEVAGSDASQAIPPLYRPKAEEHQSYGQRSLHEVASDTHSGFSSYPPGVVPVGGSIAGDHHYNGGKNPFDPSAHSTTDRRICGLRRRTFWIVLGVVVFGILLALGVGIGVGVGVSSNNGR